MSIKDIKRLTGYSYSTISRVLSGKSAEFRISPATQKKILDVAAEMNYRPNILARSLRLRRTTTVGLIVSDIRNPFFGELGSRIETLLRSRGYSTILCDTNEIPENEESYLNILVDRKVDGIILSPIRTEQWPFMEELRREVPIVLVDRIFRETALPWVASDNLGGAEGLTRRLIATGCRRIAFLGGTPGTYITEDRYAGFEAAMTAGLGGVDRSLVIYGGYSARDGTEMAERLLDRRSDIEALFCVNNLVFFGAARVVNLFEERTGRDLMMGGFDVGEFAAFCKRPLVSADQNLEEMAAAAVSLLLTSGVGADDRVDSAAEIPEPSGTLGAAGAGPGGNHRTIPVTINSYRV